ncbi:MAG: HNH endonuclease [Myxococcales bacterium]|nr:HNH endonuclease [Myxococcales bacterium]
MSVQAPTFTRVHLRKRLSDSELTGELASCARRERAALAALLGYLGQFDERKVYAAAGFTSTTAYAVYHFGWSEASSWKRIQAARLCVRFPVLLGVIADGGLHLSGVCMLAPITNEETLPRILVDAPGLKRWELQMYVDALRRELMPPETLPPSPPFQLDLSVVAAVNAETDRYCAAPVTQPAPEPPDPRWRRPLLPPPRSSTTHPLGVKVDAAFEGTLARARALLAHTDAGRDDAVLLKRALELLIETEERRRFGSKSSRSRAGGSTPKARRERQTVPVVVRNEVFVRDGGRCTFTSDDGHVCGSDYLLQLHHRVPWAKGGADTVENLTLHCATHNQLEAEREGLGRPRRQVRRAT